MSRLRNGMQQFIECVGKAGCLALCLVDVAEEFLERNGGKAEIDAVSSIMRACGKGYIYFNWNNFYDNNNMYVQYPALFLEMMTGKKWSYRHESLSYQPKQNEFAITRYERNATGKTTGHFQRDDIFEPIKDSLTVKYGKPVSLRICAPLN